MVMKGKCIMGEFDKIIGYTTIKKELEQILDIYRNKCKYDNLGVKPPAGVLIYGVPGVGKSLMANTLINSIAIKCFICRKDRPNGDFVKHIKEIFNKAASEQASIVFLDDMDKFANGDVMHPDSEEYVTVQSCIDEVKDKNVLVVATANNLSCLPDSLLRAGRFDRIIEVRTPNITDAEQIIKHYLAKKKVSDKLDYKSVVKIMNSHSCSELETIINEAGIYAGFEGAECIEMSHFLKAAMRVIFDISPSALEKSGLENVPKSLLTKMAYHEAGHTLIHEILAPESVALVSLFGSNYSNLEGITIYDMDFCASPFEKDEVLVIGALAGKAAVDQKFGSCDMGCSEDLDKAFYKVRNLITTRCTSGFHLYGDYGERSNELLSMQEKAAVTEIEKYYLRAKEIIASNNVLFENIAQQLLNKKILCSKDIENIKYNSATV